MGICHYRRDMDTFYIRSSCGSRSYVLPENSPLPRDVAILELERNQIDTRYTEARFVIKPPSDDHHKAKIVPCGNHKKATGVSTFCTMQAVDKRLPYQLFVKDDEDSHVFGISSSSDQFLQFKIQFWCWSQCQRVNFSNKKNNMRLVCRLTGQGVDDIVVYLTINVQQNPGRGAKVANSLASKSAEFESNPSSNKSWNPGPSIYPNSQLLDPKFRETIAPRNPVSFQEFGQFLKVNIEIPKMFFDALGLEQARIELVGLKRDISTLAYNRLQDSIKRKISGNDSLQKENQYLQTTILDLRQVLSGATHQTNMLLQENQDLRNRLHLCQPSVVGGTQAQMGRHADYNQNSSNKQYQKPQMN